MVWVLSLAVAVVLADSAIVTLALPEILRELGTSVTGVSWVLTAYNLVLGLAAVPAARRVLAPERAPAAAAIGLVVFAAASAACAVSGSLTALLTARIVQALGGALVITACLELLVVATGSEQTGVKRWAQAGVAGAALGPVAGGVLTELISWEAIFFVQVPIVLAALPALRALPHGTAAAAPAVAAPPRDRPDLAANAALALLSAALTAALFLLVLLLIEGWHHSPMTAAVTVTVIPIAAITAGTVARLAGGGTVSEAVAGSVLVAGGLAALGLLPDSGLGWTVAPQLLIGLGLGLTVESLTSLALDGRFPRAIHGGWTIASRHLGIVAGLLILTPVFASDLRDARAPAGEAVAALVIDAPLSPEARIAVAGELAARLLDEAGRVPDLDPVFAAIGFSDGDRAAAAELRVAVDDELRTAATRAFERAFFVASVLALLALLPVLFLLRGVARPRTPGDHTLSVAGPA